MSKAHKLECWKIPYIHSIYHLAHLSKQSVSFLESIINRHGNNYTSYTIKKRSGGYRFLNAPNDKLKTLQRWINSEILRQLPIHNSCYSYQKGRSIIECAEKHCGADWLIKFDIENFFDTINEVEVYKVFRKYGYKPLIAFSLARICTYEPSHIAINRKNWIQFNTKSDDMPFKKKLIRYFGRVPQGAPTSPIVSNLVLNDLDCALDNYAQKRGGVYSRYADDLFISFSNTNFNRKQASQVIGSVLAHVKEYGYRLNKTKIKVVPPGSKKVVLGLNINDNEVRLTKEYRKKIESHIYGVSKFGIDKHASYRGFDSVFSMIDHIFGLINHARRIEPSFGEVKYLEFKDCLRSLGIF